MRIVMLEDNPIQAETMLDELPQRLHLKPEDLLHIRTEFEFRCRIDEIRAFKPNVAVLDVMVMWSVPAPDAPPRPDEVVKEGYYTAGVRCAEALHHALRQGSSHPDWLISGVRCAEALHQSLPKLPIIFYTIVDPDELRSYLGTNAKTVADAQIITKGPDLNNVLESIRKAGSMVS